MSLKQLIIQCQKQDIKAQSQLYTLYADTLFSVCLKYSNSYTEAQDSLHDAFITIFNKIEQYKDKGSFEGWIKRITVNTVLQKYRKDIGLYPLTNEAQIADDPVVVDTHNFKLKELLTLIQELPTKYRLVFNLYVLDNYTHGEISEMLNISEGTSKSNLSRARKILANKIQNIKSAANG